MKICMVCCTYGRPHLLPRVIRCFQEQDYGDKCMVILDDAAQYVERPEMWADVDVWRDVKPLGDNILLVSVTKRYPSLGRKRNSILHMAEALFRPDAVAVCDDDDLYLPWHLTAAAKALENADWSRPSVVLAPVVVGDHWFFRQNYTGRRDNQTKERLYHPAWALRMEAIKRVGGYPNDQSGPEDKELRLRLEEAETREDDPCNYFTPSFIYCWGHNNISGMLNKDDKDGKKAWANLERKLEPTVLGTWEPEFSLHEPLINLHIEPRPF